MDPVPLQFGNTNRHTVTSPIPSDLARSANRYTSRQRDRSEIAETGSTSDLWRCDGSKRPHRAAGRYPFGSQHRV